MKNRPTSFEELPLVLTVEELAPLLNVGRSTAYELVRSGQIKHIQVGKQYRILKEELRQFLGLPDAPPPQEAASHNGYWPRRRRLPGTPTISQKEGIEHVV